MKSKSHRNTSSFETDDNSYPAISQIPSIVRRVFVSSSVMCESVRVILCHIVLRNKSCCICRGSSLYSEVVTPVEQAAADT